MIMPLFKKEWKTNYKLLLILAAAITLYSSMIIAMFDPELGDSLQMMAKSMPEIFAAFGMLDVGSTLIDFIANYLYGFILIMFPTLCAILLGGKLISAYVDRGSMAYLLSAPHKRRSLALTQAVFFALALLTLCVYACVLGIGVSEGMFKGELDITRYIYLNIGLYGYVFFLGGLCFFTSCLFSDTRYSYGISTGLCILFMMVQMISNVGDKFENLKYATPLTLFQPNAIIAGDSGAIPGLMILYGAGLLLFAVGILVFSKKDLSI